MAGEILRPPRLTGDAQTDLVGITEFLWNVYRALVTELEFVRTDSVDTSVIDDIQLAALAALSPTATSNLPYFTAVDTAALTTLSTLARTFIANTTEAGMRSTLNLGGLATVSSVTTAQIDDDAVTYAKIQNVSGADFVLGRSTAGAGNVEEIACTAAGRAILDDANAAAQRVTLGLEIGVNVQAYDAQLADVAGLSTTDNGVIIGNGANFVVESGATLKTSLGLTIGTDVQAYDADLTAIAGLTSAADKGIQFTGSGTAATFDLTAAGKALLDDADAAAQRTTLGFANGTYTPTLTGVANVAASTPRQCTYMRVGNTVTVAGQFDIDPTTTLTQTQLGISLPIASDFTTAYQAGGCANLIAIAGQSGGIYADATNNRVQMEFIPVDVTNQTMCFSFTYEIL